MCIGEGNRRRVYRGDRRRVYRGGGQEACVQGRGTGGVYRGCEGVACARLSRCMLDPLGEPIYTGVQMREYAPKTWILIAMQIGLEPTSRLQPLRVHSLF